MRKFVKMLFVLALVPPGLLAQQKVVPAINEIEPWQQVGQQPYEFTWTQREQDPHTLVDFQDLEGLDAGTLRRRAGRIAPQPRAAVVGPVCGQDCLFRRAPRKAG